MYVSATEFRTNVGKYLDIAMKEDVYVVKHGKPIVVVSASVETRLRILDSLVGKGSSETTLEDIHEMRLKDYEALN